ncbi:MULTISPECIES: MerR family transcriptional regulator [Lactobacillus]|uniref:MerR family transcriptional regulator n=1 Tax=Lactobacillus TaxID=1578 RepID=UPI002491B343|nr:MULTISPECIES: MerR family transcriptional regulator [Lactobacillus]
MSDDKYSVSEAAKLANVSPRTVRFYDEKNLVSPSSVGENGYRIYTAKEVEQLKLISYLRELGLSLKDIKKLLADKNSTRSLQLLIERQKEINEEKIEALKDKQRQIKNFEKILRPRNLKNENVADITKIMRNEIKLTHYRRKMWVYAAMIFLIEIIGIYGTVLMAKQEKVFAASLTFAIMMILIIIGGTLLTLMYYRNVAYICPNCGRKFVPKLKQFFWAAHTPKFRRLRCPECHKKSYCLEVSR